MPYCIAIRAKTLIHANPLVKFGVVHETERVVIKVIDGILGGVLEEMNISEFTLHFLGYFSQRWNSEVAIYT